MGARWQIKGNTMTTLTDRELQTLRNLGNDDAVAEIESLRAKVQAQALQILALTGEVAGLATDAGCLRSTRDGLRGPLQEYVYRTQAHAPFEHAEWVNQMGAALMQAANKVE